MNKTKLYDNFFKEVESIFTVKKLTEDFLKYIGGITVSSVHEFNESVKIHKIDKNDIISISDIYVIKKYHNQIFLPYQVNIIIGNCDSSLGLLLMEKFKAEMAYDLDYNLITVDFVHNIE